MNVFLMLLVSISGWIACMVIGLEVMGPPGVLAGHIAGIILACVCGAYFGSIE